MIYLDNNATTQPLPEVVEAVACALRNNWGNPSSSHVPGRMAKESLESSRSMVASAFGAASPSSIFFTASGTEAINLAFATLLIPEIQRILVSSTEHSAVLRAAQRWADNRAVISVPVDSDGAVDLEFLKAETKRAPSLVCVSFANNETGVIADVGAVSSICRSNRALLHIDAIQAAGKIPCCLEELGCNAASISSHKFHGPPGCGILYLGTRPTHGSFERLPAPGHQESGLRGGTENLPAIVGCGVAASVIHESLEAMPRVKELRDELETRLLALIRGAEIHGRKSPRLPNTISLFCPGRHASDMVAALDKLGVAVSAGAACSNGTYPSHVIRSMGFSDERANGTVRISLSRYACRNEIEMGAASFDEAYATTIKVYQCA